MLLPLRSVPALQHVDVEIFTLRYFGHCMQCTFCQDSCCQYGCDVNLAERDRILAMKDALAPFVAAPPADWFSTDEQEDPEYESGRFVRTRTRAGGCVFLSPMGRGCAIHAFAMAKGIDYHRIKPKVCWLFPITWDKGVLRPSSDTKDDLMCKGNGPILYDMVRDELVHAFGQALVDELDALRAGLSPAT